MALSQGDALHACVEELLRDFGRYDRAVDVVSTFEMLFTASQTALPGTIHHFERFPKVKRAIDGQTMTPDFTAVYEDGRGVVGEIAYFPLSDEGVDKLCTQIAHYDDFVALPGPTGKLLPVSHCDVLLLVPQQLGPAAIQRIIHQRFRGADHWYKPSVPPVVVQFGFDEGKYTFQHLMDAENGLFRGEPTPESDLGSWLRSGVNVKPERFTAIKTARAFINDTMNSLYLATHLWAKTFATLAVSSTERPRRTEVQPTSLAASLRADYGYVRKADVVTALKLLQKAKLAEPMGDGRWLVAWDSLGASHQDLARVLAERICRPPKSGTVTRLRKMEGRSDPQRRARQPCLSNLTAWTSWVD